MHVKELGHYAVSGNFRWLIVAMLLMGMLFLAACGSAPSAPDPTEEPTVEEPIEKPTAQPTETPSDEPTDEPTEAPTEKPTDDAPAEKSDAADDTTASSVRPAPLDTMEHTPDPMLVDITWEWVGRDPNGNASDPITVPDPENYTVIFDEAGSFAAQLDCNGGNGEYASSNIENEHRSIFMLLGPVTAAACGDDSLGDAMVQMFGPAQGYRFDDEGATIRFTWVAGGPIDTFRKAGSASSAKAGDEESRDDGESEGVADEASVPGSTPVSVTDKFDEESLILFSASRVVQEGNRVDEFEDIYMVSVQPDSAATLIIENAKQPATQLHGQSIAFRSKQSDQLGLGAYDFEADERFRYTSFKEDSTPRWNAERDRIAFASNRTGDRLWRIYIMEPIPGVNPSDLAEAADLGFGKDPDWHPSEGPIVFKGCDETGNHCGLWTMLLDGSERTPLTDSPNDSLPRWSPDGTAIAFMSDSRDSNWELYVLTVADGEIMRLTQNGANDGHPAWSPDGSRLAFMSDRNGAWGIWTLPREGGEATRITTVEDVVPNWLLHGVDWPR